MTLHTCIPHIISALDASLALNESGVSVHMDLFAYPDVAQAVAHALNIWASSKGAALEIDPEMRTSIVTLRGNRIACVHRMSPDTVVVDVDGLRAEGLL